MVLQFHPNDNFRAPIIRCREMVVQHLDKHTERETLDLVLNKLCNYPKGAGFRGDLFEKILAHNALSKSGKWEARRISDKEEEKRRSLSLRWKMCINLSPSPLHRNGLDGIANHFRILFEQLILL